MNRNSLLLIGLVLGLSVSPVSAVYQVGDSVADFCLFDSDGTEVCLSDYPSQVVLLTFWDALCTACADEAEWIETHLYPTYQASGFIPLAIGTNEDQSACSDWARDHGLTYPVLADPGNTIYPLFGTTAINPHNTVLDRVSVIHYNQWAENPAAERARIEQLVGDLVGTPYPTEIPTPGPTEPPTATPTGTTETPTPTPTGGAGDLAVDIQTNQAIYRGGDPFQLTASVQNPGASRDVDQYIILDVAQMYWFWPSWGQDADFRTGTFDAGYDEDESILTFTWPTGAGAGSGITFWHACLDQGSVNLASNVASTTFGFE